MPWPLLPALGRRLWCADGLRCASAHEIPSCRACREGLGESSNGWALLAAWREGERSYWWVLELEQEERSAQIQRAHHAERAAGLLAGVARGD